MADNMYSGYELGAFSGAVLAEQKNAAGFDRIAAYYAQCGGEPSAYIGLAREYMALGIYEYELEYYLTALQAGLYDAEIGAHINSFGARYSSGDMYYGACIGFWSMHDGDYANALRLCSEAFDAGVKVSGYTLGILYENGLGVKKDTEKAEYYYAQCCMARQDALTVRRYADILLENKREDKYGIACVLYGKMLPLDFDGRAAQNLGRLYGDDELSGGSQTQNFSFAEYYLELAVSRGNKSALASLAALYFRMIDLADDDDTAQLEVLIGKTKTTVERIYSEKVYEGYVYYAGLLAYGMGKAIRRDEGKADRILREGIQKDGDECMLAWLNYLVDGAFKRRYDTDFVLSIINRLEEKGYDVDDYRSYAGRMI